MNKAILMGRLTRDADVRVSQQNPEMMIARFTLAVDRRRRKDADPNEQQADFISCKAFGKRAEFLEKYGKKGVKFAVVGTINTGSYTNKDGQKVYTTDVLVDDIEFAESKKAAAGGNGGGEAPAAAPAAPAMAPAAPAAPANGGFGGGYPADGFMPVPDDNYDDELPFM